MSQNAPLLADDFRQHLVEFYRHAVQRFCNLVILALDVMEGQVKEKYVPTSHRAAKALLSLSGLGKVAAAVMRPPKPKADQPAADPAMSAKTLSMLSKAVNAVDLLGLNATASQKG